MAKNGNGLTIKQALWIEYYILTLNKTEAARLAGYKGNRASLGHIGHENSRKPKIMEALEERMDALAFSGQEVMLRLAQHARGTMADFLTIDEQGRPHIDLNKADEAGALGLLKKVEHTTTTKKGEELTRKVRVELYDAQDALVHIGRHHNLFTENVNVGVHVLDLKEWEAQRDKRKKAVDNLPDDK